jgi:CheY-like chemotaxis protein
LIHLWSWGKDDERTSTEGITKIAIDSISLETRVTNFNEVRDHLATENKGRPILEQFASLVLFGESVSISQRKFMAKPILLAVDDDNRVLDALVQDLRRHYGSHYRIVRAASGQSALEALTELKRRGEAVALLLSDRRMPGISGVEFLQKGMDIFPSAKRVVPTAYADTDAASRR